MAKNKALEKEEAMAAESEQNVMRYIEDAKYPASREDLISAAKSNDASQEVVELIEGLAEQGSEYNNPDEVREALAYEDQEIEQRES
jgi:Protein of unknown function (DUF2795)